MSFLTPRTNLFAIMESLGFVAVKDAFDFEQIGNTKLDKGFHVEQGTISGEAHNQNAVDFDNLQTLRFYAKGNKNTNLTMDQILTDLETILNTVMDISNRVNGVRNVLFVDFSAVPHSEGNNDIVRGELTLNYKQILCFTAP